MKDSAWLLLTAALAGVQWGSWGSDIPQAHIRQTGLDPENPVIRRAIHFATRLLGFPRHLSQHVGGFVITRGRLDDLVPIENAAMADRTVVEWNKDDLDTLRILKIDVLGLGMLSCLRRGFALLKTHYGVTRDLSMQDEDEATYRMIRRADTVVAVGRRILPKVETLVEGRSCLELLSGRAHKVLTAVAVHAPGGRAVARLVETRLHFKRLSTAEIDAYLALGEGIGKAGGYAIQGQAGAFVMAIQGSYPAVVGLPLYETACLLDGVVWARIALTLALPRTHDRRNSRDDVHDMVHADDGIVT